jgi:hypothetical protein
VGALPHTPTAPTLVPIVGSQVFSTNFEEKKREEKKKKKEEELCLVSFRLQHRMLVRASYAKGCHALSIAIGGPAFAESCVELFLLPMKFIEGNS